MTKLAFVDTETTGLDPDVHEIWEVGLIVREGRKDTEYLWNLSVDLGRADPRSLEIGGFHKRHRQGHHWAYLDNVLPETPKPKFAVEFSKLTQGAHLVGNVISFDEERLRKLLKANGSCPEWHYHLVDVEALLAGKQARTPPWESYSLSMEAGIDPAKYDKHTALGDARWARDQYDSVMQ